MLSRADLKVKELRQSMDRLKAESEKLEASLQRESLRILVNGQAFPINPSVFFTSNGQGTMIDTGTTLAYLFWHSFYLNANITKQISVFFFYLVIYTFGCNILSFV